MNNKIFKNHEELKQELKIKFNKLNNNNEKITIKVYQIEEKKYYLRKAIATEIIENDYCELSLDITALEEYAIKHYSDYSVWKDDYHRKIELKRYLIVENLWELEMFDGEIYIDCIDALRTYRLTNKELFYLADDCKYYTDDEITINLLVEEIIENDIVINGDKIKIQRNFDDYDKIDIITKINDETETITIEEFRNHKNVNEFMEEFKFLFEEVEC